MGVGYRGEKKRFAAEKIAAMRALHRQFDRGAAPPADCPLGMGVISYPPAHLNNVNFTPFTEEWVPWDRNAPPFPAARDSRIPHGCR